MIRLLILADDFTGALDTGVQFASEGIATKVIIASQWKEIDCLKMEEQVLVVNAETRHLSKEEAYQRVFALVSGAEEAGVPFIYKKTDSALRGNIGSELTAVLDATILYKKGKILPFLPAFPQINRITQDGIHYIDGVPVSQSVFGQDPFEPVRQDLVEEIIASQSEVQTVVINNEEEAIKQERAIWIYNTATEAELERQANWLKEQDLCHILAGCAGFATKLSRILKLEKGERRPERMRSKLFVLCGSVNPITQKQLDFGESCGYSRIRLKPEAKLEKGYWDTQKGEEVICSLQKALEQTDCCIIDSNDKEGESSTAIYAQANGILLEEMRVQISEALGRVGRKLLEKQISAVFLITGGDTLLGFMRELQVSELVPICELAVGIVLTRLNYQGKYYHVITKSGGFGQEDLLKQLVEIVKKQEE